MPTDPPLDQTSMALRHAILGNAESMRWIVERLSPLLLSQARHRIRRHLQGKYEPEDLVQDVWMTTIPRLAGLKPRDGRMTPVLLRFLSQVLVHRYGTLLQKHIYGKPIEQTLPSGPQALVAAATAAFDNACRLEQKSTISQHIDELPERERAVVIQRGIEQSSNAEVATLLGLEASHVAVIYHRALRKLRDRFPDSVFEELEAPDALQA